MSYLNRLTPQPPSGQMIRFGDYFFSSPAPLGGAGLLAGMASPGLYVVMAYAPAWQPLPYRPVYFGESDKIWGRATPSHDNYASWNREAGTATMCRGFHHMAESTQRERPSAPVQAKNARNGRASSGRIQRWLSPYPCACAPTAAPPGRACPAGPRKRDRPCPSRTRLFWLDRLLPGRK